MLQYNMGAAFTPEEQLLIRTGLKNAARKYLTTLGMKKTSVDQLVADVGISKGAFYKFYETKEHLFFELIEDIHDEIYNSVAQIINDTSLSTPTERLEKAMLCAFQILNSTEMLNFLTDEWPYVIRKISPNKIEEHMLDDMLNIEALLSDAGISLNYSPAFISSLVRAIISITREKHIIGEAYFDEVAHFMIHTLCTKMLEGATITEK